jgi:hypothetical protein
MSANAATPSVGRECAPLPAMISPETGRAVRWSAMDAGQPSIVPRYGGKRNWLTLRWPGGYEAKTAEN